MGKIKSDFKLDDTIKYSSCDDMSGDDDVDADISTETLKEKYSKVDLISRHEIINNLYKSLIIVTKPKIFLFLVFLAILMYPFSRFELPITHGGLLMNYLGVSFEIITACSSFILGAIVSNWASSKIGK